ncbi:MAG: hypothetical protein A2915_02520 [Candidatus Yanofskybacteria bacterium RIFCSPLOWO2_01_FULL_41_34]|uniref:Phosphoribosyltransferase domain-containing protein n=1 Tax=Candidatus Yanofskybacteria bacterium RIFCSPHIGHO2_01_FULL_41_26 TaxID=1802661 RepID=A0A1F8EG37_9BACT|nr:MAG: hypothetical protein A2649_04070 [Candidatus Yanofskybacteria bacterium RIFCSPHIGHO2_01_FULL_41_26]OGN20911.1 MAG: hypothetical protein A2915_02520 [Candidatus Yanofskybacteria bacterium RIFCSPLOWO2_01_FULL_41_34]
MTNLSWKEVDKITAELINKIKTSGFKPDYLVGITVGGLIPLGMLAKSMDMNTVVTVSANSYKGQKRGNLNIAYLPSIDLTGKKVLLIDEIAGSGETLRQISQILLKQYKVSELKTAVFVISKDECKFLPDFHIVETTEWVVFPWEKRKPTK